MSFYDIMLAEKLGGGGGITPTGTKEITANGMYDVASFANADVDVPNTYTQSDEGKVVSNGALVAQSSVVKTANGTYDTTLNDEVVVAVPQPAGTISITQNGTGIDVAQYALADVNVSGGGSQELIGLIQGDITSLNIPSDVTDIRSYAFYQLTSLESVTFPSVLQSIGTSAFNHCDSLESVVFPVVASMGVSIFSNCIGLESITFANGVTTIPQRVAQNCTSLTSISIPNSVTTIEDVAFSGCTALTSVVVPNSVSQIKTSAFYNCTALTTVDIGTGITSIGSIAFKGCTSLMSITVRSTNPPDINTDTFDSVPTSANIYVPSGSVDAYKNAYGWSRRASYIQAIQE